MTQNKAVENAKAHMAAKKSKPPEETPLESSLNSGCLVAPSGGSQTMADAATGRILIPDAYKSLGVESGFDPPDPEKLGMLLLGFSGAGKTSFISSIPGALIVTFQPTAASSVVAAKACRIFVSSWDEWDKLRNRLLADAKAGKQTFGTVCIDTGDEWFGICAQKVIKTWNDAYGKSAQTIGEVGQQGKGYGDTAVLIVKELRAIESAGYGWVLTGHLTEKTLNVGGMDVTKIRPVLTNSAFKMVNMLAYFKCSIAPRMITRKSITKELPGGKKHTTMVDLPDSEHRREYHLLIRGQAVDDEKESRMPNMPSNIILSAHDGWGDFRGAWDAAVEQNREEDKTLSGAVPEHS